MIFNEPWHNGVYLHAIVQESHTALPINPYPGYIFHPIPSFKGIRIQEGSLCMTFYALGVPPWGTFNMVNFPGGVQAPFIGAIPSFQFKCKPVLDANTSGQAQMKWSRLLQ